MSCAPSSSRGVSDNAVAWPSSSPVPAGASTVGLSAERLHALALEAFRIGNRGRLSLCETLRVLSETRLYLDLGFSGLAPYADAFFQLGRAEAFEYVRVATSLVELTELREAFGAGRIGWSVLKAITRVASVAGQASWIDFAREHGVERTIAEAREARRRGRDLPRESAFGLPNLDQKLVLRFSRSDMDRVRSWIEGTSARVAEKTGADDVSLEQAILFLCEQDAPGSHAPVAPAGTQVVYQCCPDCRRSRVGTRDGFVEVTTEEVERREGCAEPVVLDGPTPPRMRRRILARDASRCGNPRCTHRAAHCHHIVFRSRGGKTELANEVAVCATCHALIHAGLLRVTGSADETLCWLPVACPRVPGRGTARNRMAADRLPVLHLEGQAATYDEGESSIADSDTGSLDVEMLACGLVRLGVPVARSRTAVTAAIHALPRAGLTEANVLRKAVASI